MLEDLHDEPGVDPGMFPGGQPHRVSDKNAHLQGEPPSCLVLGAGGKVGSWTFDKQSERRHAQMVIRLIVDVKSSC